jgi:sec-independent protein translocase protein TatA
MGRIGGPQLVLILFIVLILFGSRRLPDLAGSIGRSMKEFRKETAELRDGEGETPDGRSGARGETERGGTDRDA